MSNDSGRAGLLVVLAVSAAAAIFAIGHAAGTAPYTTAGGDVTHTQTGSHTGSQGAADRCLGPLDVAYAATEAYDTAAAAHQADRANAARDAVIETVLQAPSCFTPGLRRWARTAESSDSLSFPAPRADPDDRDPTAPATSSGSEGTGPSALCADGTYSYSLTHQGTCSWHGGVAEFYR